MSNLAGRAAQASAPLRSGVPAKALRSVRNQPLERSFDPHHARQLLQLTKQLARLEVQLPTSSMLERLALLEHRVELLQHRQRSATLQDRQRWAKYLLQLGALHRDGLITEFQATTVLDVWQRAIELEPNVAYPTAGRTESGSVYMSWSPRDRVLTFEVSSTGCSWFFMDRLTGAYDGSDDESEPAVPAKFFSFLRTFIRQ